MTFCIRCTVDYKKYWYYAGKEKIDGKYEPCFISEKEYKHGSPIQQFTKAEKHRHLPLIEKQGWKRIDLVEIK